MRYSSKLCQQATAVFSLLLLQQRIDAFPHHTNAAALIKRVDNSWPIKTGYVAFGDSYGAGMGTGSTSWDACRIGTSNIGDLMFTYTGNPKIDYQRKVCSGDTTVGLNRQIDEWKNPQKADVATVSIGGNDVYFSDLAWYCIITPNPVDFNTQKECEDVKTKAKSLMDDPSDKGLRSKLAKAYKRILDKSGRDDFHVYVTGYIPFFNYDDPDCDKTTFSWLLERYDPRTAFGAVLLKKALRREIDDLVDKLNNVIRGAVDDANHARGKQLVHVVDVNPRFNGHRWCEAGDFHEPAGDRPETWFFLSGWRDFDLKDAGTSVGGTSISGLVEGLEAGQAQADIDHLKADKGIKLPDAATCNAGLGSDPDPMNHWKCRMSEAIAANPGGVAAQNLKAANDDIQKGDYSTQHVGFWQFTRQIKTFHPRTAGMYAYRNAVIDSIRQNQGASVATNPPQATDRKCNGLDNKKYVSQKILAANIKDFCNQAMKQGAPDKNSGSISRILNAKTPDEVDISLDWPAGSEFKLNEDECNSALNALSNGCDANSTPNPMNWKCGGQITSSKVVYHIAPRAVRQPIPNKPGGGCHSDAHVVYNSWTVWGSGYESFSYGQEAGGLLEQLRFKCGAVTDWTFDYGLGENGREWTASGKLPILTGNCVGLAIQLAGGPKVQCTGDV